MNLMKLHDNATIPWTPEQWDRIRAAGIQYEKDIKDPWDKAYQDTRQLGRDWAHAKAQGRHTDATRLESEIRNHPSMVAFLEAQKVALAKRSASFPRIGS